METRVLLQVRGIDLDDVQTVETVSRHLDDLGWESGGGLVTAILYTEASDPVRAALEAALAIEKMVSGSEVVQVDEQLVSVGDIADRLGITSEAVRLWSVGKRRARTRPFPTPSAVVSQGRTTMKLWAWADVLEWLRAEYQLDPEPDVRYLSRYETACLNARLANPAPDSAAWRTVAESGPLPAERRGH